MLHAKPARIWIYGSRIRDDGQKYSDLDIAYDDPEISLEGYSKILEAIEGLDTLVKIDVKNIFKADPRFADRVRSSGKVIFSATKEQKVEDALYNLKNAIAKLKIIIDQKQRYIDEGFSDVYNDILVKRFEFTFEMAWKTLKRHLDFEGIVALSPRAVIKESFQLNLLPEDTLWLHMLDRRNLSSHIYDEWQINEMAEEIPLFFTAINNMFLKLSSLT